MLAVSTIMDFVLHYHVARPYHLKRLPIVLYWLKIEC